LTAQNCASSSYESLRCARIWKLLGEPKTKAGKMKKWHYIEASDTTGLVEKPKEVISVWPEA
jgi:hypothetical protein